MKVVTDPLYGDHLRGIGHPDSPDRVEMVAAFLRERGSLHAENDVSARDATDVEIERVHRAQYLELVKRETEQTHDAVVALSTGDVLIGPASLAVARRAAGGALRALEVAVQDKAPVFALVRPPGHHAEAARGMGFCIFNNAAIAARAFQHEHGGRVLLVDFDYHHGNGTENIAGEGLSYISTHASPAYPGTGYEIASHDGDLLVNIPVPASGIGTEAFVALWERVLALSVPFVRPSAIVVSAGFDYVAGDPVGDLGVDVRAASSLARLINDVAARYCENRVVYVLEGGYDIAALSNSVAQVLDSGNEDAALGHAMSDAIPPAQQAMLARVEACAR